jgi:DNA-binding IclR family transcriptional regulator
VGASFPLHAVAVGKALLAFAPVEDRDRYLRDTDLAAFTPHTRTEPARLSAELDAIRAEGIARDEQEYKRGLRAFAAPVFGPDGAVAAAIALPLLAGAAPVDDARLEQEYIAALRDAARATTRNLGGG